jgi:hypothetical protein
LPKQEALVRAMAIIHPHVARIGVPSDLRQNTLVRWKSLGEVCCAIDSHVDRPLLIEVFSHSAAQRFLRAVHHEQTPPKFSSNTRVTKECYGQKNRSIQ